MTGPAHDPDFALDDANAAHVVSLCGHLDGIPLAIELAAARLRSLSIADIEDRLGDRFRLLTGGSRTALPRQQTLRALIDWSYESLNSRDRVVFDRLAVFAGGFDLDAAQEVCATEDVESFEVMDAIGSLVDKSLVQADPSENSVRYRLLETIRQYAAERLGRALRGTLFGQRSPCRGLPRTGRSWGGHFHGPEQTEWLARLETEHDNMRAAMAYLLEDQRWVGQSTPPRGRARSILVPEGLLQRGSESPARRDRASGCRKSRQRCGHGALPDWHRCIYPAVTSRRPVLLSKTGLLIARRVDDPALTADVLDMSALIDFLAGDYETASSKIDEAVALSRQGGGAWLIALTLTPSRVDHPVARTRAGTS